MIDPIQKNELTSFTIPRIVLAESKDNLFQGRIPKLPIFRLVSNKAFSGRYINNSLLFHPYDPNYLSLAMDGDNIPHRPFKPVFESVDTVREYLALHQALTYCRRDDGLETNLYSFCRGTSEHLTQFAKLNLLTNFAK